MSKREDPTKHTNKIFQLHQLLLAFAINVWDYPSRREKYTMKIARKPEDIKAEFNYVLIPDLNYESKDPNENKLCSFYLNNVAKDHFPIHYELNSSAIPSLNRRLSNFIKESVSKYDRDSLFINASSFLKPNKVGVKDTTISTWLRQKVSHKNIGIDTFRMAFVSYYFPLFNNLQRQVMRIRMRTSIDVMMRSYLKYYQGPDALAEIKMEATDELKKKVSRGKSSASSMVVQDASEDDEDSAAAQAAQAAQAAAAAAGRAAEPVPLPKKNKNNKPIVIIQPDAAADDDDDAAADDDEVQDIQDERNKNFKKWYTKSENREKHNNKSKSAKTYAVRYVRELNNGKRTIDRLSDAIKQKYGIVFQNGQYATTMN